MTAIPKLAGVPGFSQRNHPVNSGPPNLDKKQEVKMSGPKKTFTVKLLIPMTKEMKDELMRRAGNKNAAALVRSLIELFFAKELDK